MAGMNKREWKAAHRWSRVVRRLAREAIEDAFIYGTSFQKIDETGIYNIPPEEVIVLPARGDAIFDRGMP